MVVADGLNSLQLEKLLRIEVSLLTGQQPGAWRLKDELPWSSQAIDRDPVAELLPDFVSVTEFDPRLAHFLQGRWVAPPDGD